MREQYLAGWRSFLLGGLIFCGWAVYEHHRITQFEADGRLVLWWKLFDDLYDWGGKWAVVGFLLGIASIFFATSAWFLRTLWKLPQESGPAAE